VVVELVWAMAAKGRSVAKKTAVRQEAFVFIGILGGFIYLFLST
jgi:hypothetical protein